MLPSVAFTSHPNALCVLCEAFFLLYCYNDKHAIPCRAPTYQLWYIFPGLRPDTGCAHQDNYKMRPAQRESRRVKETARKQRGEAGGDGEIPLSDATLQNKHVIVKEDTRTWAWGRKQINCERSKSDRKAEIERAGTGAREGQSWRHVKAEITGYPCVISLGVYLRLPQRYRRLSPSLTK